MSHGPPSQIPLSLSLCLQVNAAIKEEMTKDILAFRLEVKAYQTPRLIVQNVQAVREDLFS